MRVASIGLAILLATLPILSVASDGKHPMTSISGKAYRAIEIAVRQLEAKGMAVDDYLVTVQEFDEKTAQELTGIPSAAIIVSFDDPNRDPRQFGSGALPGFNVALEAKTLKVLRAGLSK